MRRRKIGSVTPIFAQELFIKPHFDMLSSLDRNVVLLQERPLPNYKKEHGYPDKPDLSEKILRDYFPKVEIFPSHFPENTEFSAELYNEGLRLMEACDIVLRLDPDMFFTKDDWAAFIDYIDKTDFDCYRLDFYNDSINYYMTGDFSHGLKDAQEFDPLAVNPKRLFQNVLDYPRENETLVNIEDFMMHHFRGWNKPKSTPTDWHLYPEVFELVDKYGDNGKWFVCPDEIKNMIEPWLKELEILKHEN